MHKNLPTRYDHNLGKYSLQVIPFSLVFLENTIFQGTFFEILTYSNIFLAQSINNFGCCAQKSEP
jgi:hypothetical protein